jgi:hypothetical protein
MYEIGTNTPIYGDRDGKIKYRVADLTPERQTGYSWQGAYGIPEVIRYHDEVKAAGRAAILAKRTAAETKAKTPASRAARAQALAPRVREIVAALDAQGRWLGGGGRRNPAPQITTGLFIANLRTLADYVEAAK